MKDKFNPLPGSVDVGICLSSVFGFSIASLFSSLLGSRVVPALALLESSYAHPNASQRSRLDSISLLNLSLCRHISPHSRVSLLKLIKLIKLINFNKLIKLIRVVTMRRQDIQKFSTRILFQIVYQAIKIVHIIGQSGMIGILTPGKTKKFLRNHKSRFGHFRLHHAS